MPQRIVVGVSPDLLIMVLEEALVEVSQRPFGLEVPPTIRDRRREAFLDAAEALFLDQGFERTSLVQIVGRSRGSLSTLYEHFGSKQGLLHALAARWRTEVVGGVGDQPGKGGSNAETLCMFARRQFAKMSSPRSIALMKMVFSESLRDEDFAAQTYRDLHLPVLDELAVLFAQWNELGGARIDDPEAAARYFMSLTAGDTVLGKLFGVNEASLAEQEIDWRVEKFVQQFGIT